VSSDASKPNQDPGNPDASVLERPEPKVKKPSMYRVLMLNDDFTPMDFVIEVLQSIFNKNGDEATKIMLNVHNRGVGVCGTYTYEVAETKVAQVMDAARRSQHPLQCSLEPEQ